MEELQVINHWLNSGKTSFLSDNSLDESFFFVHTDIVSFIEDFINLHKAVPSHNTVLSNFDEDYNVIENLDPMSYLSKSMIERKAFSKFKHVIEDSFSKIEQDKIFDILNQMRSEIDDIVKLDNDKVEPYDWVSDAVERYEQYMERHGKEGMAGLPTGFNGLDEITGGWREDDLIMILGRVNEGKSLVGLFFSYIVWRHQLSIGSNKPIIFFSTEMSELELAYRLDTLRCHFSNRQLNEGRLVNPENYKEYLESLAKEETPFLIYTHKTNGDKPFKPSRIRAVIEDKEPALVVIDQLYDLEDERYHREIRHRVVEITRKLRDINLNSKTPVIIVNQAGRGAVSNKSDPEATPDLEHTQESDMPAQKASKVISLRLLDEGTKLKLTFKKGRAAKKNLSVYARVDIDTGLWTEESEESMNF